MGSIVKKRIFATFVFSMVALLGLAGCGGDDTTAPPAAEPTVTLESAVGEPTQIVIAVDVEDEHPPIENPVVPLEEPVAGSDEEAILAAFEETIRATNNEDWAAFLAVCDPRLVKVHTIEQLKFIYDIHIAPYSPPQSANRRNVVVEIVDEETAQVYSDLYEYDEFAFGDFADKFVKVDGQWFMSSLFCHGGNSAIVEVEVEPTIELTEDVAEKFRTETRSMPVVDFPAAISKGADRIGKAEVIESWTEFLVGTRQIVFNGSLIMDWCADGVGTWVYETGAPEFTGASFDYELLNDPGGSWNSIVAIIKLHDQKLFDLMNYAGGDGFRVGLAPSGVLEDWEAYESPGCA